VYQRESDELCFSVIREILNSVKKRRRNSGLNYFNPLSANVVHTRHDTDVACKVKFIKNGLSVFERGETLLQNGMLHFVFKFSEFTYTKNRLF